MAKRLGVRSREAAAAPLRRSPRLKKPTQNPNPKLPVWKPQSEALSRSQSETRSTPASGKPKRGNVGKGKENGSGGKGTGVRNGCGDVKEKDSVLGSVSTRRRSPRLARIGEPGMEQDGGGVRKKGGCEIVKLRLEEACPQGVCDNVSEKVIDMGTGNDKKRLPKLGKVGGNHVGRRRSPRLVLADITNSSSNFEITKKSARLRKSGKSKTSLPHKKNDTSSPSACTPDVRNKASKNDCKKKSSDNCSKERRKSCRLAGQSDKVELSCSEEGEIGLASQQCPPSVCENGTNKVAVSALKPPLPPNQRRSRGNGNQPNEIKKRKRKFKCVEESDSDYESEESPIGRKRKREESAETEAPGEIANGQLGDYSDGWTEEQEIALHKAYFSAKPSPHFWKKVAKMVPGKSAQDCFNKIQSTYATPPSIPAKTRLNKGSQMDSPFKKFNLLDPNSPKDRTCADPKTRRVLKQKKTRGDKKTLRNLLKKQRLVDQVHDADYFSQFEASPVYLPSDVKLPSELCKDRSNLDRENNTKPAPNQNQLDPSPEVLKQIKNIELHEKYINHLHYVDARRKACVKACGNKGKEVDLGIKAGDLRDAKTALVSEAQDFIGCYKKLQADPFGVCTLSDEDDDDVL